MFYPKINLKKKVTDAKINFTSFENSMNTEVDEALLPYKSAKISYNYNVKNGALKNGYGFEELTLPKIGDLGERTIIPPISPVLKLWHYKFYDYKRGKNFNELIMFCEDGQMFSCVIRADGPFAGPLASDYTFTSIPNAVNYRLNSEDAFLISSATDGMWKYVQNKKVEKVENSPHIISMCLHYERLFAVVGGERNRLAFSANLDPTDWEEDLSSGGFIEMQDDRGALSCVISHNDYVYVFRDFGVARVSAYGDQADFSVSQLFKSSVKLYGNTVTLCGNKVLLLARDGIHTFDGYSTKKLNLGIDSLFENVDNDNACGIYYNNKFFLACSLNFDDGEKVGCEGYDGGYINNALLEIDLSTNEISITRGVDISSLLVLDDGSFSKVVATFNGEHKGKIGQLTEDGKLFGVPLLKKWVSPKSNMGEPTKIKRIKECLIKTKTDCKIKIKTEKGEKEFKVKGSDVSQRLKLNVYGEQLQVEFISDGDGETEISCPNLIVGVTH